MNRKTLIELLLVLSVLAFMPGLAASQSSTPDFTIVSKSSQYMDIRFALPKYEIASQRHAGSDYQKIVMPNADYLSEVGMPELPILSTMLAIPDHGTAWVEMVNSSSKVIGDVIPLPVQDLASTNGEFQINSDYYRNGSKSPAKVIDCSSPEIMRDFRLITIHIQPFAWDAASHQLRVHEELTMRVHFSNEPGINELNGPRTISPVFDKLYSGLILNYADFRAALNPNTPPRMIFLYGENNDPTFQGMLNNFALWKRQKGADVQLLSTATTGTSNVSIKTYLQTLYDDPQTRPDYIVIIGDVTGSFPIPGWSTDGFGDYPYQMLGGTDLLGDVFIGRISAENTSQLDVILAKVYAYEKNINVNNAQYLNRMLLTSDTLYNGISVVNLSYYIRDISLEVNPDYTYTMLNQNSPSPAAMNTAINQGVGFFNYRGYAGMSGWSVNDNNLYNINKLCHSVIITCNTGNYDVTATTEQIIRVGTSASPKGAVTSIGMWSAGTATMPNNALCGGIYTGIFNEDMRTMGEALLYSKLNFSRLYAISNPNMCTTFNQWCNLMGDPTMEVFTGIPNTFNSNLPATVPAGTQTLDFTVLDAEGFPIPNAWVTVTHVDGSNSVIIGRAFTSETGMVYLPFGTAVTTGSLVITVSKHNFKPLQQNVTLESGSLLAGTHQIDDDNLGASSGNSNGVPNSGETLELLMSLRNTSSNTISGITGFITSSDPQVTIVDSLLSFTSVASGAFAYSTIPVLIHISADTPHLTLLRFTLQLTDSEQNNYSVAAYLLVSDANLQFVSLQVMSGNNVLDPGETATINITLHNAGSRVVENLIGELFTGNDMLSVVDSLAAFGTVNINQDAFTLSDNFTLYGRSTLVPGMIIPLRLKLSTAAGFVQWLDFSIPIGIVTVQDPLGPDNYGYLIYDDGDTGYAECPDYDWIGIAPAEGGAGSALNISDPESPGEGDGLDAISLAAVNLPFTFRFYGEDHNLITVCSNGFIVMGATENCEFRNYRLPGPMGPSPMIAAFWDDLATGPGSGVYTWFDANNHTYIIEWYQMQNGYQNNYPETFQIILYDPAFYPTSFGDGPIKIQYHTFNNVDSGATNQNHGNFCSIGIESGDQLDGLEYSFMNTYPQAASPLGNGRALYITNKPVYYNNAWLITSDLVTNGEINNITEPGASLELGVMVQNLGNNPATEVRATISSLDPYVTIINNSSAYHPIAGHSQGVNLDAFTVAVSPSCPNNHNIAFDIQIVSAQGTWNQAFQLVIRKPGLLYDSFYLNDFNGNNNGSADPGETFLMIVNLRNPSEMTAFDLVGELSSTDGNVSINNPSFTRPALESGSLTQFVYQVSLSSSTPLNTTIPLSFTLNSSNAAAVSASIALGCGDMGMFSGFESDNAGFTAQNGWAWGMPEQTSAHSGSRLWATNLAGQYGNGANYILTSQPVSIGTNAELSFWHQLSCQGNFDGGNVSVSLNGGTSWIVINPSSGGSYINSVYSMNEPGFSGVVGEWTKVTFNLAAFANNEILIRWHFTSDGSVTGYGWFIDDVLVSGFAVRAGNISGTVTLSDGASATPTKVMTDLVGSPIQTNPNSTGLYTMYLPDGSYSLTASLPYYVSEASPVFIINSGVLDYVHDFPLDALPAVTGFSLDYSQETASVLLNWTAPEAPLYPVVEYNVYRKTGPGVFELLSAVTSTTYGEEQSLAGHYYYMIQPVYAAGVGAPSDTLDLLIEDPSANIDPSPSLVNRLHPNFPNPFNPSTTIPVELAKSGAVSLRIYNLKGQLVKTLTKGILNAGKHQIVWQGRDENNQPVASGLYLYRLETDGFSQSRKMLLVK